MRRYLRDHETFLSDGLADFHLGHLVSLLDFLLVGHRQQSFCIGILDGLSTAVHLLGIQPHLIAVFAQLSVFQSCGFLRDRVLIRSVPGIVPLAGRYQLYLEAHGLLSLVEADHMNYQLPGDLHKALLIGRCHLQQALTLLAEGGGTELCDSSLAALPHPGPCTCGRGLRG